MQKRKSNKLKFNLKIKFRKIIKINNNNKKLFPKLNHKKKNKLIKLKLILNNKKKLKKFMKFIKFNNLNKKKSKKIRKKKKKKKKKIKIMK